MVSNMVNSFSLENNKAVFYMNAVAINLALPILKEYKRRHNVPNAIISEVVTKFFKCEMERVGYKDENGMDINLLDGDYPTASAYPTGTLFCMFEKALLGDIPSPYAKVAKLFEITKEGGNVSPRQFAGVDAMCCKFVEEFSNWNDMDEDRKFINASLGGVIGSLLSAVGVIGEEVVSLHPLYKAIVRKHATERVVSEYKDEQGDYTLMSEIRDYIYFDTKLESLPVLKDFIGTIQSSLVTELFDVVNNICVVGNDMVRKGATIVELFNYRRSIN